MTVHGDTPVGFPRVDPEEEGVSGLGEQDGEEAVSYDVEGRREVCRAHEVTDVYYVVVQPPGGVKDAVEDVEDVKDGGAEVGVLPLG